MKMKKQTSEPAVTTVRGFHTPSVTSGDEDSDTGTPRRTLTLRKLDDIITATASDMSNSGTNSGAATPRNIPAKTSGIKQLFERMDALKLERQQNGTASFFQMKKAQLNRYDSNHTSPERSDDDESDITTYKVPIEHDFVSKDVKEEQTVDGEIMPEMPRKMTSADFQSLRCLGKGAFGTVHLVKQVGTGRLYAQKQLRKAHITVQKSMVEQTKTERAILESVNRHPFVVKLYYAFQDQEKLYLILEYAQGGELFTHLHNERMFTEEKATFYLAEMMLALDYLHHDLGVVYRDLKPENCLLDHEGHLLLTDFGLSKVSIDGDDKPCTSFLGTTEYLAPEVILEKPYGFAVDWWSFGALGFELMTGSSPFASSNNSRIYDKILKGNVNLPYYLSAEAKDLITRLLRKQPHKRLGYNMPKDMIIMKKHRFFRKIDWKKLERRELTPPIVPVITDPELAENFADEFTSLPLSPVLERGQWGPTDSKLDVSNPFGGFSYVASESVLECGFLGEALRNEDQNYGLAH
jgi:serine/threonine protein kinase